MLEDGRRCGKPPTPYVPPTVPAPKIDLTDPNSRKVTTPRGWVQGDAAQAVAKRRPHRDRRRSHGLLVGLRSPPPDSERRRARACCGGRHRQAGGRAPDAGYWHRLYTFMRRVLATDPRRRALRQRQGMIEPVFADLKQPAHRALPTSRTRRGALGMAAVHRHPQPAQVLAPPQRPGTGLIRRGHPPAARWALNCHPDGGQLRRRPLCDSLHG